MQVEPQEKFYIFQISKMTDFKLNKCAFCNIIQNNENILFRNDKLVIIKDIRPASDHHYLAIPLMHIQDSTKLTANDRPLCEFAVHRFSLHI